VLAATLVFFAVSFIVPKIIPIAAITLVIMEGVVALGLWRVRSWSAREGWSARHRLAIAMGVVAFFGLIFAPLQEFAGLTGHAGKAGLTLAGVLVLLGLFALDWRLRRRAAAAVPPGAPALMESGDRAG
jgi:hypothetical protein